MASFTADAWILGERWQHHRVRDHFGVDTDLFVVLSEDVGPYVAFTPLHYVIEDMVSRIVALESGEKQTGSFTADAFIATSGTYGKGAIFADAVIRKTGMAGSFTADAVLKRGGSFTADAFILLAFTADAYIV